MDGNVDLLDETGRIEEGAFEGSDARHGPKIKKIIQVTSRYFFFNSSVFFVHPRFDKFLGSIQRKMFFLQLEGRKFITSKKIRMYHKIRFNQDKNKMSPC